MDDAGTAQLELYLNALAGAAPASAYLELRHRVGEQLLAAEFHAVDDRDRLIASIRRRSPRTDVYIGCAPRSRRSGTRNDIEQVWVLWAECDGAAAAQAAQTYEPKPPIVIASGSGPNLHAYWPLRRPLTAREAEVANLRLAHALGADRACYDAARILRPPGTLNHKRRPPTRVKALRLEAAIRCDVADVVAHAPEIDDQPIERRWSDRGERDPHADPLFASHRSSTSVCCSVCGHGPARRWPARSMPTSIRACTSTRAQPAAGAASHAGAEARSTTSPRRYGASERVGRSSWTCDAASQRTSRET